MRISRVAGIIVVAVEGLLEEAHDRPLGHVFEDLVVGQGNHSVVVDLLRVVPGRGSPLGAFCSASAQLAGRNGRFRMVDPPRRLAGELEDAGLGELLACTRRLGARAQNGMAVADAELCRALGLAAHPAGGSRPADPIPEPSRVWA